ncbi:ion transporter [Reinekea sp.]|uniref:ion transporter n=1 Tax=Reinekea sp. TaxID=1970455 RepID=UPI002A8220BF|nr:ion transporter [Reinekea sp.]
MNFKTSVHRLLNSQETRSARIVAFSIHGLILLSVVTFSISTLPDLGQSEIMILRWIEIITVLIFTVEYLLRVWVDKRPGKFILSFSGLIDLAAILPFYIASGLDLRAMRALRLLRLVRMLKLAKYNKAIRRFQKALLIAKEEMILFCVVSLILLYLSAMGIYYFEHVAQPERFKSVFHSLWWAVTTLTTVGYGDMFPITVGGKIFTFFVLMIGLGIIAIPTGLLASALAAARKGEDAP